MPWSFSVGFRWSIGRLTGWSEQRRLIALPPNEAVSIRLSAPEAGYESESLSPILYTFSNISIY